VFAVATGVPAMVALPQRLSMAPVKWPVLGRRVDARREVADGFHHLERITPDLGKPAESVRKLKSSFGSERSVGSDGRLWRRYR